MRNSLPFGGSRGHRGDDAQSGPGRLRFLSAIHADERHPVLGHRRAGTHRLGDYLDRPAEPFNDHEPVDSSAAAIAAQGLLRWVSYLETHGDTGGGGSRYWQAG